MKKKITLVSGCDWQGLYIDGILKIQDHSLYAVDVLETIEDIADVEYHNVDDEWMVEYGQLPDKLEEVKIEKMWIVTYKVKFSEKWCADECKWVEHSTNITADTPHQARKLFRQEARRQLCIVGKHVSTREA